MSELRSRWASFTGSKSKQNRRRSANLTIHNLEDRFCSAGFATGSIQGQDGWSGGNVRIPAQVDQGVNQSEA